MVKQKQVGFQPPGRSKKCKKVCIDELTDSIEQKMEGMVGHNTYRIYTGSAQAAPMHLIGPQQDILPTQACREGAIIGYSLVLCRESARCDCMGCTYVQAQVCRISLPCADNSRPVPRAGHMCSG